MALQLRQQETPYGAETSRHMFQRPLVATDGALRTFEWGIIYNAYLELQQLARDQRGLDYVQVFVTDLLSWDGPRLWFVEDALAVTALLPSEY